MRSEWGEGAQPGRFKDSSKDSPNKAPISSERPNRDRHLPVKTSAIHFEDDRYKDSPTVNV
jgi:hypothetical protein